jgi:5'-3' exonuclease
MKETKPLKNFKTFISEMAEEMLDSEITFYPKDVKFDKEGKVSSYGMKVVLYLDSDKKHQELKDKGFQRALVSFLSDKEIKKQLQSNPEGVIFTTEIYASTDVKKGLLMYFYLGNKKIYL